MYAKRDAEVAAMISLAIERMAAHADLERIFQPAVECLRLCHSQGLKTALVTSKSAVELAPFLQRFPGASAVDVTVCASDVVNPKPDPESARLACQRMGVAPAESILIGDSVFDLRCARSAGTACIAVAYGAGRREDLLKEEPDLLFAAPEDLLAWAQDAFLQTTCHAKSQITP
jgi:HAD superfamily hydrolase (TIGR01509 family)